MKLVIITEILTIKKKQKAIEQELGCEFIRIDPDKKDFDTFKAINEIFRRIKQSFNQVTKKALIHKISMKLLKLEFQADNIIKSKAIKNITNKILPYYE